MEKCAGLVSCRKTQTPLISAADHQRIIENMRDVPEETPAVRIGLSEVGISSKIVWVKLRQGLLPFEADISVSLPAGFRGIHMSRMEGVISELHEQEFEDIRHYSTELGSQILKFQRGDSVTVLLSGKMPLLTKTFVSNKPSLDSLTVFAKTKAFRRNNTIATTTKIGVQVAHITACPCTQVYLQDFVSCANKGVLPCPTHSQRSLTLLLLEDKRGGIGFDDLLTCLQSGLHVVQDLLKRPDEAELVMKSHLKPQFAEDAVRSVAEQVFVNLADRLEPDSVIEIESVSLESIHLHNVRCRLVMTFAELNAELNV